MEIQNVSIDNSLISNWFSSALMYGQGDYGTPGIPYDGTINIDFPPNIPKMDWTNRGGLTKPRSRK